MINTMHETATMATVCTKGKAKSKLEIIDNLLNALHQSGIHYCHWKSNEHLNASMMGDTDLDVLFDETQKVVVERVLTSIGFKKFNAIRQKQYRDIEDFIALDAVSGKIVHLHTHYRLTMGEAYVKSYQLNIEKVILDTRIIDEDFGIYCSHPAYELVLLYIRAALKIQYRDIIKMYVKNRINYTGNIISEYQWLRQRTTEKELDEAISTIFNDNVAIKEFIKGPFDRVQLSKLSILLAKELKTQRQYSAVYAKCLKWYREVSIKWFRKSARLFDRPIVAQRINPRSGLVISVIGADGSGKSTVIANLQSTFKKKLDVYRIYLGKGDGKMSWQRKALRSLKGTPKPKGEALKSISSIGNDKIKKSSFKNTVFQCLEALIVAGEKKKNLKQMRIAKQKGMLVICDRFPQNQMMGYNDGPMLSHLRNSSFSIFRVFSKLESRVYEYAENHPPDVVFKLIADAEVVEARKPGETRMEVLEAKIEGIRKVRFKDTCKVITVDASQPLEEVLYKVKSEIWANYL